MANKLGLYVQVGHDPDIRRKLTQVRPSVVTVHLDGGDLIPWLRQALPETFVVGRYWWSPQDQDRLLGVENGIALAEQMLGITGASQCHALMLFNEYLGSPYEAGWESLPGKPDKPPDTGWLGRAQRYDAMQVAFRERLLREGLEAVAWNFGAGNWAEAGWYERRQPLTWGSYRYFGHHIYGWPRLVGADPWWLSSLDATLRVMDAMADRVHIVTELAVTRMYAEQGPDVGWLSEPEPIPLESYVQDLERVHGLLCERRHVLGAALFNAAPEGTWGTFAVTGELVERVSGFRCQEGGRPGEPGGGNHGGLPVQPVLRLPFDGEHRMTQGFGARPEVYKAFGLKGHEGVDWKLPLKTPVLAAAAGVVDRVDTVDTGDKKKDPYGLSVRIKHQGFTTWYAHLGRVDVKKGQEVEAGQQIGLSGSTGNSEGPHLHMSLRLDGANEADGYLGRIDPMPFFKAAAVPPAMDRKRQLIAEIRTRFDELEGLL